MTGLAAFTWVLSFNNPCSVRGVQQNHTASCHLSGTELGFEPWFPLPDRRWVSVQREKHWWVSVRTV